MNSVQLSSIGILLSVKKRKEQASSWSFGMARSKKCRDECDSPSSSDSTILNLFVKYNVPFFKYGLYLRLKMQSINNDSTRVPINHSLVPMEQNRVRSSSPTITSGNMVFILNPPPVYFRDTESKEIAGVGRGAALFQNCGHCSRFPRGQRAK